MVRIHVKHGDDDPIINAKFEFLYDSESSSKIEDIRNQLTELANLQRQIHRIGSVLLPKLSALLHTNHQAIGLHRALSDAASYSSKDQVLHGRPLSKLVLKEHIRSIEKEFSESHHSLGIAESNLEEVLSELELLQENSIKLWWAGKDLDTEKLLWVYVGKNEKTKVRQIERRYSNIVMIKPQSLNNPTLPQNPYRRDVSNHKIANVSLAIENAIIATLLSC